VSDTQNYRVVSITDAGTDDESVSEIYSDAGHHRPFGIAVDAKDNVYITQWASGRLVKVNSKGYNVLGLGRQLVLKNAVGIHDCCSV
jgi:sugar lactone lactonase YvrE